MKSLCLKTCVAAAMVAWLPAMAATFTIDQFSVTRNGSSLFFDSFDDGVAPPGGHTVFAGTSSSAYRQPIAVNLSGAE